MNIPIGSQSPYIAQSVARAYESRVEGSLEMLAAQGAGDQGLMLGLAVDESPETHAAADRDRAQLARRLAEVRKDGTVPYLRPDGKLQVTIEYVHDRRVRLDTVVVSSQHAADIDLNTLLKPDIEKRVIFPVIALLGLDRELPPLGGSDRPLRDRRSDG